MTKRFRQKFVFGAFDCKTFEALDPDGADVHTEDLLLAAADLEELKDKALAAIRGNHFGRNVGLILPVQELEAMLKNFFILSLRGKHECWSLASLTSLALCLQVALPEWSTFRVLLSKEGS